MSGLTSTDLTYVEGALISAYRRLDVAGQRSMLECAMLMRNASLSGASDREIKLWVIRRAGLLRRRCFDGDNSAEVIEFPSSPPALRGE